jgi:CHASE3 domain sensor protein
MKILLLFGAGGIIFIVMLCYVYCMSNSYNDRLFSVTSNNEHTMINNNIFVDTTLSKA